MKIIYRYLYIFFSAFTTPLLNYKITKTLAPASRERSSIVIVKYRTSATSKIQFALSKKVDGIEKALHAALQPFYNGRGQVGGVQQQKAATTPFAQWARTLKIHSAKAVVPFEMG